jgi:hypothetical protein
VANGLREAYLKAVYRVPGCAFTLRETPSGLELFGGRAFAVITAYNPRSEKMSDAENRERHAALEAVVRARGFSYAPSCSTSPAGTWREEGLVVFDATLAEALELGRQFDQHAVLYGQGGRVTLAWCEDGGLERFYPHPSRHEHEEVAHGRERAE